MPTGRATRGARSRTTQPLTCAMDLHTLLADLAVILLAAVPVFPALRRLGLPPMVVFSTTYKVVRTGLFTAIAGWVFSNVLYLTPIGELSFHGQALSLLAV